MTNTYLVTGGMGCIGAWTLYHLRKQGKKVVNFDLSDDRHRLDLLMSREEQADITFVQGDLRDPEQVNAVFQDHNITHVIHLAALQIPMCRANPILGAQVNVTGTVNIFEATKNIGIKHIAGASSIAVYGNADEYPAGAVKDDAPKLPHTLYGVYKVANERTAVVYHQDYGITSTMLRPYTVYGLGRDQGLTSEPTKAILSAIKGEDYHISFGGRMQFHFASDTALQFIACAENPLDGAYVFNMGTPPIAVTEVAELIMNALPNANITVGDIILPFPEEHNATELHSHFDAIYETPLKDGIQQTITAFQHLAQAGKV